MYSAEHNVQEVDLALFREKGMYGDLCARELNGRDLVARADSR